MSESNIKVKVSKREKEAINLEVLQQMSNKELIDKIIQLDAHNIQLKNILQKKNSNAVQEESLSKKKKKIDFEKCPKRHVLLKFYYFGWDYQGYVTQEDTNNTIEFHLFHALQKCCLIENREKSNYHRCGRTDKGVSAFSQVISIDLRSRVSEPLVSNVDKEFPYCTMLNRILPENIKCYAWCHVDSNVSARFDCSWRMYKYYFPKGNLNLQAMEEASKFLIGTHDFRNFCKMDVGNGVTDFHREIAFVKIIPSTSSNDTLGYQMLELQIRGKSFLWHQIRCIMSVLFLVGQEKESPTVVKELLDVKKNPNKPQYSLAHYLPLNLFNVEYEGVPTTWVTDQDVKKTIELLQSQWTQCSIRCAMIKDVIEDLQKLSNEPVENQVESLLQGVKPKAYKPLLDRMKCESLENKINHFVKKRKLEIIENTDV